MSYKANNLPLNKHHFFGRKGGVSEGKYASLNVLGVSQDIRARVDQNRQTAVESIGGKIENLMLLSQQSGTNVYFAEEASVAKIPADGIVTKTPEMILGLFTADCLPVLLGDYEHGVIGVAHAGWRGAVRGVVENTLDLMIEKGAQKETICAALGPCIQQYSFEVGAEVRDECTAINAAYARFFAIGKDLTHFQFDLEGLARYRLEQFGIKNISASGLDTYVDEENYFSFRRDTHRGLVQVERDFACHMSLIKL